MILIKMTNLEQYQYMYLLYLKQFKTYTPPHFRVPNLSHNEHRQIIAS